MKFTAVVIPSGNATGVEVPLEIAKAVSPVVRPPVVVTINGHSWRSRFARVGGQILIGINAATRKATGIAEGETIEVDVVLDEAPRIVDEPADLAQALDQNPKARAAFDRLPFGLKRKHLTDIGAAKSAETRARRIAKLVETLARE